MDMIDWWTVRGDIWGVKNVDFKVELRPDHDLMTKDLDSYTAEEQITLSQGFWGFVEVTVIPVGQDLTDHIHTKQSRDSVEWGEMPGGRVDREHLFDVVKELAEQAATELDRTGFALETTEGSAFAPENLKAPF
jgi:hypothetical protein